MMKLIKSKRNSMKTKIIGHDHLILLTLLFFTSASPFVNAQQPTETNQTNVANSKDYRIGPGDVIDVVVARNDTLSRNGVRVNNEGKIQLPMIDESVPAACLTERELADQLRERYKKYLIKPHVYVAVTNFNSKPVALIGAVVTPGRFQLQRSVRLLELLTFVNGPGNNAGRTIQIIHDPSFDRCQAAESKEEIVFYALDDTLQGREQANPFVEPGDIIRVVEADQAYILGNVRSAMTINLNETITLTQAIARAGGVLPDSNTEKIRLQRQNKTPIFINLKNINKQLAEDVVLQPNDIVEVPGEGGSKKLLKDLLRTVVPGIMSLPTRIIPVP